MPEGVCAEHPTSLPDVKKISAVLLMMLQTDTIAGALRQKAPCNAHV